MNLRHRAFTLIEIMVVISIVTLLSSMISVNLVEGRQKANDAKKKVEVGQVEKAIMLQKDATGYVPLNYTSGGAGLAREGTTAFNNSMQELVNRKYLSAIPDSPDDSYVYYSSNASNTAVFGASLTSSAPVDSSKSSCPSLPLPYSSCQSAIAPGLVYLDGPASESFCSLYSTQNVCYPNANGQLPSLQCQYAPGLFRCFTLLRTAVNYCTLNTGAVSTCSGGGKDYCTCINN